MDTASVVNLKTIQGQQIEFVLQPPADVDSFFLFSLHKAGSTLLNKMMRTVCDKLSIPRFEPEEIEFDAGVKLGTLDPEVQSLFFKKGYCFGGFRSWSPYLDGMDMSQYKKILLIRDPRDILVSHYFSHKFSHNIPKGPLGENMQAFRESLDSKSIDEYALQRAIVVQGRFPEYEEKLIDENTRVYRYEDVIFEKKQWLADMLEFVGLHMDRSESDQIAGRFDNRPTEENPSAHVRKVTPGDHKEKLQPETIEKLNEIFAAVLEKYDYI